MRLDRKFAVLVGFSLIWAALVSAIFYRLIARPGRQRPQEEKPLVVAVQPLQFGSVIKPESVKLIRVPVKLFPRGGFSVVQDVVERPVISPIQPEEPVVEARIAARGSGVGVSPLIPAGMRAISVRVNDVVGVAGFVLPGMRVDVLVTGRPPGRDDTVTTTVLQNITVLSAGQTIQADANKQSINAPVVTLLVNPSQAEALTLANTEGRIQLVLRNSTDSQLAQTPGRQLRDLYGVERRETLPVPASPPRRPTPAPSAPAAAPPAPEPAPDGVLIIRGNQKTLEPLESKVGVK
ncbi:MAG: Flp pilus assembly protein CpaB [Terriglobia bacterium]|nr:MAG: Flp pilus assembly protein CpaB [Terriglobia bacterium]